MNIEVLIPYRGVIKQFFNLSIILIICLSISILNSKVALAHKNGADKDGKITGTPVHQYIAWESGNAWKQIPAEMRQYLFLDKDRDNVIYQLLSPMCYAPGGSIVYNIITGSGDEDQVRNPIRTINYFGGCADRKEEENCTGFGLNGFVEHFWNPDKPKSDGFNCGQTGGWYNEGLRDTVLSEPHNDEHWDSNYRLAQFYWDHLVLPLYKNGDKAMAYYYLGRVVHLLTDLTVPAHVHNDVHVLDPDKFEEFMKTPGNLYRYSGMLYKDEIYRYEELEEKIRGVKPDFKWDNVHDQQDPPSLFKLFWFTAQKTQYFASNASDGDWGKFVNWNGNDDHFDKPGRRGLWTKIPAVNIVYKKSDVEGKVSQIADALIPHAIKAVAGLYRLFWIETHPKAKNVGPILLLLLEDNSLQTCTDSDGDNYYVQSNCDTEVDCDDSNPAINPGTVEICDDGIDQDCNGYDLSCVNISPIATITTPSDGSSYIEGNTIIFNGTGEDTEDGILTGSSLVWTSSIDGQIGTGKSFTRNGLSVGAHIITLNATDSDGATGSNSVTVTVGEVDVTGTWSGTYSTSIIPSAQVTYTIIQSGTDVTGTYSTSTGVGGTGGGTYSGTLSGNIITFTLNQTTLGCPGTFNGTATVIDDTMNFVFEGYDCGGYHANGQGNARKVVDIPRLPEPIQISPTDGSVFDHYPRTTTLTWQSVSGASSYSVEVDCFNCCGFNQWCSDIGETWHLISDIQTTEYTFNWVGAQPGRWRVWAIDANGIEGYKSPWWEFVYTQ
jgi:hypothetical protein